MTMTMNITMNTIMTMRRKKTILIAIMSMECATVITTIITTVRGKQRNMASAHLYIIVANRLTSTNLTGLSQKTGQRI